MAKLKVLKRQGNDFNEQKFVMTMIKYYSLNHIYSILDKICTNFAIFLPWKKFEFSKRIEKNFKFWKKNEFFRIVLFITMPSEESRLRHPANDPAET